MHSSLFLVLALSSAVVLAKPHVQFAEDGTSYAYSFQSPSVTLQRLVAPVVPTQHVYRTLLPQASPLIYGSSINYNVAPVAAPVSYVPVVRNVAAPANIQLSADGFVLDTPEVAQAKAAHLAEVAKEQAKAVNVEETEVNQEVAEDTVEVAAPVVPVVRTVVQPANIQLSSDGFVLDTPEVAQAKAEHFARFASEAAAQSLLVQPIRVFEQAPVVSVKSAEVADVRVGADGHLLDTPEVAHAKAAHLAQYAEDAARAVAAGGDSGDYSDDSAVVVPATPLRQILVPNHAPADIKVSSEGFVLDTPEVASAKASHLATKAAIEATATSYVEPAPIAVPIPAPHFLSYAGPSIAYTGPSVAYTVENKWNGPAADVKLGSDGFLIDTPEVQQARAEHLATRSSVQAQSGVWSGASARYAAPVLSADGQYLLDTPEVAQAKAEHLAAHAEESIKNAAVKTLNYGQLVYSVPTVKTTVAPTFLPYAYNPVYRYLSYRYAPTAAPVALTADGQYLLDTPEVAAAKADHYAAHARARGY